MTMPKGLVPDGHPETLPESLNAVHWKRWCKYRGAEVPGLQEIVFATRAPHSFPCVCCQDGTQTSSGEGADAKAAPGRRAAGSSTHPSSEAHSTFYRGSLQNFVAVLLEESALKTGGSLHTQQSQRANKQLSLRAAPKIGVETRPAKVGQRTAWCCKRAASKLRSQ